MCPTPRAERAWAGVFVGGASRRMGGAPKGLLPAPDTGEALVARLVRVAREAGLEPVLVGDPGPYRAVLGEIVALADEPAGVGPLGGLSALLAHARERAAVALACDAPYVTAEVLARLRAHPSRAAVLAPRGPAPDAPYEPLLARYDARRVRPALAAALARGVRSFQALFATLEVEVFPLEPGEARVLEDWDTPEDRARGVHS